MTTITDTTSTDSTAAPAFDPSWCIAYGVPEHAHPVEDLGPDWLCPDCSERLTADVDRDQRDALALRGLRRIAGSRKGTRANAHETTAQAIALLRANDMGHVADRFVTEDHAEALEEDERHQVCAEALEHLADHDRRQLRLPSVLCATCAPDGHEPARDHDGPVTTDDHRLELLRGLEPVSARRAAARLLRLTGQGALVQRLVDEDYTEARAYRVARAVQALETVPHRLRTVAALRDAGLREVVTALVELDRDDAVRLIAADAQLPDLDSDAGDESRHVAGGPFTDWHGVPSQHPPTWR